MNEWREEKEKIAMTVHDGVRREERREKGGFRAKQSWVGEWEQFLDIMGRRQHGLHGTSAFETRRPGSRGMN